MSEAIPQPGSEPPLVIDLDGTLLRGDLLQESALQVLTTAPLQFLRWPGWLAQGKAVLKRGIAERAALDIPSLPFDTRVLDLIHRERSAGRQVVLCTASDEIYARAVAAHLGCFDEVIASDGHTNISAERKARRLVERFGPQGFDYAGNARDDLPVWAAARHALVVSAPAAVARAARRSGVVVQELPPAPGAARAWLKALRPHQWLKNLLVLLPLLGAHRLGEADLLLLALGAFIAFGLCASSVYIINDLADLPSDRRHPRKRQRPFAAGQLLPAHGIAAAALLLATALTLALAVGLPFAGWLGVYFAVTVAYTFWLKRKLLLDAMTLAGLYTLRVIGGAAAVGLTTSFWLLAISMCLFLSLALVKRFVELLTMIDEGRSATAGRAYLAQDMVLVQMLGVASGFAAVLVLGLYINSEQVIQLYRRPELMWLAPPLLLYWIGRVWLSAQRRLVDDDPLMFALRDRTSLIFVVLFLCVMAAASVPW